MTTLLWADYVFSGKSFLGYMSFQDAGFSSFRVGRALLFWFIVILGRQYFEVVFLVVEFRDVGASNVTQKIDTFSACQILGTKVAHCRIFSEVADHARGQNHSL